MAKVVLHKIEDWAVARHIGPALRAAGVPEAALGRMFYFYPEGTRDPFASIEEGDGVAGAEDALLAVAGALGRLGHALVDTGKDDDRTAGFHWSADEATLAAAAKRKKHEVVPVRGTAQALADEAGEAIAALRAGGKSDAEILAAMRAGGVAGKYDGSFDFACVSFLGRLDALPEDALRTLLKLVSDIGDDLQTLAGLACAAFATPERLQALELATVNALSAAGDEELAERCERVFRARVLADERAAFGDLMQVFDDTEGVVEGKKDRARFDAAWKAAMAREDYPLHQWVYALNRSAIDRETFDRHAVAAFRRSVEEGFSTADGYGDMDSFEACFELVAKADPDLALAGFMMLSQHFNENGLRRLLDHVDDLPKKGYSAAALSAAAAHFSQPERRSAAKIFGKALAKRGIELTTPAPPPLEAINFECDVGTDVATLVIGSFTAVEKVSEMEDLDDCAALIRKTKSLGFMTGGDGWYRVRVAGAKNEKAAAALATGTLIGVAPLRIDDDTLTVSGVVGGGGAPTIPFPSGTYAARLLGHEDGNPSLTVIVYPTKSPPKWPFGKDDLPDM